MIYDIILYYIILYYIILYYISNKFIYKERDIEENAEVTGVANPFSLKRRLENMMSIATTRAAPQ